MIYALTDLLTKMGAPETREKGHMEWHYFDKKKNQLAGFAEIRLEAGGEILTAELKHLREDYEDEDGRRHPVYTESFFLYAERTAQPGYYRVTRVAFDGDEYDKPSKAVIELALSVFYARALDISVRMVEQSFNKQDILEPADSLALFKKVVMPKEEPKHERTGVVIPFRQRRLEVRAL